MISLTLLPLSSYQERDKTRRIKMKVNIPKNPKTLPNMIDFNIEQVEYSTTRARPPTTSSRFDLNGFISFSNTETGRKSRYPKSAQSAENIRKSI